MIKVVSVIMAAILCLCILPTAGISAEEGVYYAHIAGFTAVYDQNTQKVEFCVEFDGSVLESEEFVVRIHCSVLEPITNKWVSDQTINAHQLSYGACLREGNRLVGAIPLDGSKFNSEYYKDFRISVSGKTVESGGNLYYTLDSKDIPLSPKAAYNGEAVTVVPKLLPANTAVGGYVLLKLSVTDIPATLSGGLTSLELVLNYNSALLRLEEVFMEAKGENWTISSFGAEGNVGFKLTGGGVYEDDDLVLSLKFMTLGVGSCDFGIERLKGGDGYGNSFSLETAPLDARLKIEGTPAPLGDVNGDGRVDNLDAAWVLQYDAMLRETIENGDVNSDRQTNSIDASLILRLDAGLITEF